jgi:hypothetical protein
MEDFLQKTLNQYVNETFAPSLYIPHYDIVTRSFSISKIHTYEFTMILTITSEQMPAVLSVSEYGSLYEATASLVHTIRNRCNESLYIFDDDLEVRNDMFQATGFNRTVSLRLTIKMNSDFQSCQLIA